MANITTTEFAAELNTDARTARKFLRSITPKDEQPGKGSRWAIDGSKRSLTQMRKNFNTWHAAQLEERAKRAQDAADAAANEVEDDTETPTDA